MTSVYEKKKLRQHAEQIPLYNSIILREKRDSNIMHKILLRNKKLSRKYISHLQRRPFTFTVTVFTFI